MVLPIILMCLCALVMSYFLYEKVGKGYSLKAVFLKTIASMLFIALGAYCFYHSGAGHYFPPLAMVALALGMLGDIFLDMKYVFRDHDKEFTNAGFLVFGLGHIAYVTGMILEFFQFWFLVYD